MRELIKNKRNFFIGLALIAFGVCLDRYTKLLILNFFVENPGSTLKIFPGFNLVLVFNKGIAFGIFNHGSFLKFMPLVLLFLTIIIVCGVVYLFWKENNNIITFSLLITGGLGNILDRLTFGAVVDFLDFYIGKYHWPAFNIADSCICIGIILFLFFNKGDTTTKKIIQKRK
jgi:signal peptidase II